MKFKEKKKITLTTKIFIGLLAGIALGLVFNLLIPSGHIKDDIIINGIFYVIGQGFIRLMKMLVVPLVLCSLVCGVTSMDDTKSIGKIGITTVVYYMVTTAVAVAIAIALALFVKPGEGLEMSKIVSMGITNNSEKVSLWDTILDMIPENPFYSLSSSTMLQVIVFALILGIVLVQIGNRVPTVIKIFREANDIMMAMTVFVMNMAPLGVFCMMTNTVASLGFNAFLPLLKYIGSVAVGLAIQCLIVYSLMIIVFMRANPFKFYKKMFPVMAFAFSTSSSNATIPMNIEYLEKRIGVSRKISSFTIPLGATINMNGTSIMQGIAAIFAAQAYGIDLGIGSYLTIIATAILASIGTAGIPSVGTITLTMVFASVGLPIEAIGLIMGVDRIVDMLRTVVNITGDSVCTTIIAKQNGLLDKAVYNGDVSEE